MNHHEDLPDSELEGQLRTAFAADASRSPRPDDLTSYAIRRARAQRRRTAAATAALSVVVVVVGVTVVQQLGPATSVAPPADNTPTPGPTRTPLPSESMLMFRGVEVPVPASMLEPGNVQCGTPLADAAYVIDPSVPIEACLPHPPHPERFTEVVLQPLSSVAGQDRVAGETVLPDGRTRVASRMPQGGVWLSVTSPDPARAQSLFGGARVVAVTNGCPIRATFPEPAEPDNLGLIGGRVTVDEAATTGQVCGYRTGWVTGAAVLTERQVRELADMVRQARVTSFATVDCAISDVAPNSGWTIVLSDAKFWVNAGAPCTPLIDESGRASFTDPFLSSTLWSLAPGPGAFDSGQPGVK